MSGQCVQLTSEGRRRVSDMTLRVVWERVVRVWRIRKIKRDLLERDIATLREQEETLSIQLENQINLNSQLVPKCE